MRLLPGENQGMAWDINSSGAAVGTVFGSIDGFNKAVMWPRLSSEPIVVNSMIPTNNPYEMQVARSIGDDFSMCVIGEPIPVTTSYNTYYIGIQPASAIGAVLPLAHSKF
jgi:hypothetical protein